MKILYIGMKRTNNLNSMLLIICNKCAMGRWLAAKVTTVEDMWELMVEKIKKKKSGIIHIIQKIHQLIIDMVQ